MASKTRTPYTSIYSAERIGAALWEERVSLTQDSRASVDVADPWIGRQVELLSAEYARFQGTPIPALRFSDYKRFESTGDRLGFETAYFSRRRRLMVSGLLCWLGKGAFSELEDLLWAVCDEYAWSLPAHFNGMSLDPEGIELGEGIGISQDQNLDLFACETAYTLAELLHLLEPRLTPLVAARVRKEVFRRVLDPFEHLAVQWSWEGMVNNWCAVCASSIGAAALYLYEDTELLGAIIGRLLATLDRFLDSFDDDGVCIEGLSYWTYGVGFFSSFGELLEKRSGGRVDLLRDPKFTRIAEFQQACYLNEAFTVSFSDGSLHDTFRSGLTHYLCSRFPRLRLPPEERRADILEDPCGRWALAIRDLWWTRTALRGTPSFESEDPPVYFFPQAQWLISPAKVGSGQLAFAAKGGHNGEPHNHNDIGSFILCAGEDVFCCDLGAGEYTKDYFSEKRYTILCNSSLGHSVPVINGREQEAGSEHTGRILSSGKKGGGVFLELDLTGAYGDRTLQSLIRCFDFNPHTCRLTLRDSVSFSSGEGIFMERFITSIPPVKSDESIDIVSIPGKHGTLHISCMPSIPFIIHSALHHTHEGKEQEIFLIDVAYRVSGKEPFQVTTTFSLVP